MIRIGKISKDEEEYYFAYDKGKWREVKVKNKVWHSVKSQKYFEAEISEEEGTIIKRVFKKENNTIIDYFVIENGELKELILNCKEIDKILEESVFICEYKDKVKFYKYKGKLFEDKVQLQNYIYNQIKREFDNDLIKVEGKMKVETSKAYLFSIKGKEVWIPKSVCSFNENYIEIPLWFAKSNYIISEKEYNQIISEKMKKYEEELSKIVFI
ncbi:hypothetical protein SJAV_08170 [Sulfurisphaera javensis]|uniref:Uncharacterized protein n=1 Tax=Sulfurisphaera javensis TaxID=2049879 RepID=A0AAT9GPT8_9CREN